MGASRDEIYVIDPLGNLIHFDRDPNWMKQDLTRVVQVREFSISVSFSARRRKHITGFLSAWVASMNTQAVRR